MQSSATASWFEPVGEWRSVEYTPGTSVLLPPSRPHDDQVSSLLTHLQLSQIDFDSILALQPLTTTRDKSKSQTLKASQKLAFSEAAPHHLTKLRNVLPPPFFDREAYLQQAFFKPWYEVKPSNQNHNLVCPRSNDVWRNRKHLVFTDERAFESAVIGPMN